MSDFNEEYFPENLTPAENIEAGIKHFSVHSLRHTNITLQIMAGVPVTTVAGRAGHVKTSTTTDTYAYYIQSSDKSAAQTLNNIFSNVVEGKNNV